MGAKKKTEELKRDTQPSPAVGDSAVDEWLANDGAEEPVTKNELAPIVLPSDADTKPSDPANTWTRHEDIPLAVSKGPFGKPPVHVPQSVKVPQKDGSLLDVPVQFVQSKYVNRTNANRLVTLIVLHCTENAELEGMARMNANLFASDKSPHASVHYFVDDKDVYQCASEDDVACATGDQSPGSVDAKAISIEIVGRANQSASQWADDYSRNALYRAMGLVADICQRRNIGAVYVDEAELHAGCAQGITTHAQVSLAFHKSTHTDPGPSFPLAAFVNGVQWTLMRLANPTAM